MARLPSVSLKSLTLKLPWVGEVTLTPDDVERRAAWELYVELVTRVAVQDPRDQGLQREALNSLYSLFHSTRQILRAAGPKVGASPNSVGGIAITVLNQGLRPVLNEWHPRLLAFEATRAAQVSPPEHEAAWSYTPELRGVLHQLRKELAQYARALGIIAGVENDGAAPPSPAKTG